MREIDIQAAEHIARDVTIVRLLLLERADLLAACESFLNADRSEHLAARLNDAEMAAVESMKAAVAKARGLK